MVTSRRCPADWTRRLRRTLNHLDRGCRDLLTWAAFLGDGGSLDDLEALAPVEFDRLVDDVEAAGLLHDDGDRYRFDHPLLRHVLYHEPGGHRRRRLHLQIADHLESRHGFDGRRATEIADHLRHAGASADPARLARSCLAAGEQAYSIGAWGAAARYYDLTLATDPPDDAVQRCRLAWRAGLGHFRDHDLSNAEQRLLESIADAKDVGEVDVWASAALLLTRARMTIGPGSVGARIDTSVLDELRSAVPDDERRVGEIVGLLAEIRFHAFDFEGGSRFSRRLRELAVRSGDQELITNLGLAKGLQHLGRLELDAAVTSFHESADHAGRLPDPWKRVGVGRLPLAEIASGDLAAAVKHVAESAAIAATNHDWAEHALASACTTQVAAARGDFAGAETAGAVALQMYRRSDYSFVPLLVGTALAAVRSARGDINGANAALDDWSDAGGRSLTPYRLLIKASTGDRDGLLAGRRFRPVGGQPVNLFTLPVLCAQVEVAAALGDGGLAADAVGPLAGAHASGVRWCLGWPLLLSRLLATANRVQGRAHEVERWCAVAAAEATSGGAVAELARVTLERACSRRHPASSTRRASWQRTRHPRSTPSGCCRRRTRHGA